MSELDRLIHEPARLRIVALLSGTEEAGYVQIEKTFRGKIPLTLARLTPEGRSAFQSYRRSMNGLLR